MKMATIFATVCLMALSLVHFANTLDCPPKVYAEFMKDVIIDCKISDVGNVYWYKGNSTKTSPIVKLQDGRMYTFQGHGHYDINENGSLVVVDLEEEHFGVYSVVHFYSNSKSETDQIQLEIAVKPRVACPSINGCFNCSDECTLLVKTTDILTCSIIRALPAVDIKILVNSGSGIRVLRNASNKTFDPVTGTWNTTSVIEYEWHDCSLSTLITCATRDLQAFELSDRIVTIQSDLCTKTTKNSTTSHQDIPEMNEELFIIVAALLAFLLVAMVFIALIYRCLKASIQHQRDDFRNTEQSHLLQKEIERRNAVVDRLVEVLADEYKAYSFSDCLPNGRSISNDAIFTGIYFTLSDENDHNKYMSSGPNLIHEFFQRIGRVFLVVGDEFLTKALLYYACSLFVRYNRDQEIIFILDLEGLTRKNDLADAIVSKLKLDGKVTTDEVKDILQNCNCLIIVKGVECLKTDQEEFEKSNDTNNEDKMTTDDLLKNSHCLSKCGKLRWLVLAKTGGCWKNVISSHFIRSQIDKLIPQNWSKYVSDVFKYYNTVSESIPKTPQGDPEENFKNEAEYFTKYVFNENNIVEKIGLSQSMLILFSHVVVSDITKRKIDLSELCLYRRSYLIETILYCFEIQYSNISDHPATFEELKMILGRAGLPQDEKCNPFTEASTLASEFSVRKIQDEIQSINLKEALLIGFLKSSNEHDVTSEECAVSLCDNVIQEHLVALVITSENLLENFLNSFCWSENERMRQVLQLMYGTKPNTRSLIAKILLKEKKWDILIDCLFESENERDFEMITGKDGTVHEVKVSELNRYSHRLAFCRFCKILASNKVRLRELSFKGYWSREWFINWKIPQVEKVEFIQVDFSNQTEYNYAVKFCNERNVKRRNVSFTECHLPGSQKPFSEITSK